MRTSISVFVIGYFCLIECVRGRRWCVDCRMVWVWKQRGCLLGDRSQTLGGCYGDGVPRPHPHPYIILIRELATSQARPTTSPVVLVWRLTNKEMYIEKPRAQADSRLLSWGRYDRGRLQTNNTTALLMLNLSQGLRNIRYSAPAGCAGKVKRKADFQSFQLGQATSPSIGSRTLASADSSHFTSRRQKHWLFQRMSSFNPKNH